MGFTPTINGMSTEYRELTLDDYEQAATVESRAFYERPNETRVEILRQFYQPDWTVGAFVDGRLVADVRTIPQVRRMNGGTTAFGAVGPVTCLAQYRRQGHVGRLLTMSLERMRERGQALSGLYTPHDALYRRYGWERAEGKKRHDFRPKDVRLRFRGKPGTISDAGPDDWQRLDKIYREGTQDGNGPFVRVEVWWHEGVLRNYDEATMARQDRDVAIWTDGAGNDAGYIVYHNASIPTSGLQPQQRVFVRDFVALTSDAYLGLWEHMLTHDLASSVVYEARLDDPFRDAIEDPFRVQTEWAEGAMLRVVDVERALSQRRCPAAAPTSFTMKIDDPAAPWNAGIWLVETGNGETHAAKTAARAEVEMTVNSLAALYTGFMTPAAAARTGFISVDEPSALARMANVFSVTDLPYCPEYY
jgi:predicted acetyltransferase